ncbi:MAG TPA: calcium/proton exchanger [Blastocatellia bacterium]|nr:calcium/proton exchanger [Blastocatellia bacterium]
MRQSTKRLLTEHGLELLLVFIPVAAVFHYTRRPAVWTFVASALAIVPLAGLMGKATETLGSRLGAGIGGLLNATFGNAAEMIIAIQGLRAGLGEVVKASITGSILGNLLLVLGLSALAGGLKHKSQKFNRTAASMSATMLFLSAIGLLVPAIFHWVTGGSKSEAELSVEIAIVLFVTYVLSLVFALRTHKDLYLGEDHSETRGPWPGWKRPVAMLIVATALIAWMSELLVHAVEPASAALGMTEVFVGVIVVAVIGNAAEHSSAILVAMKNKMDLAFHIAAGSSMQIALFVAPILVFVSYAIGRPMDLLFTTFEVLAVGLAVAVVSMVAVDGESNWMEGVLLLAVYLIFALAFFFLPASQLSTNALVVVQAP